MEVPSLVHRAIGLGMTMRNQRITISDSDDANLKMAAATESIKPSAATQSPIVPFRDVMPEQSRDQDTANVTKTKADIARIRRNRNVPDVERSEQILTSVRESLEQRGAFHHDNVYSYLFLNAPR